MKKQSFTMRLFSVLLCVAMLCTFAPLTTLAKMAEQVFVGGIEVTADNAADVLGDGTVSYDKYTKTLTVKSTGIYDTYDTEEGSFGIYSNSDLNVVLEGDSLIDLYSADVKDVLVGIEAKGDLTVTGKGSVSCNIPPANDFAAGFVAGGALTVDVTADQEEMTIGPVGYTMIFVGKAAESYAFVGESIHFVLGNAPVEAMADTAVFSTAPTLENFEFVECGGGLETPDSDDFEPIFGKELLKTIERIRFFWADFLEFPDVEIGGVKLTMENMNDVLGDGTVYFDLETWELVLDNATITDVCYDEREGTVCGIVEHDYAELDIRLVGENVIDLRDAVEAMEPQPISTIGIAHENVEDIAFFGNGSLTIYAGDAQGYSYGMYMDDLMTYGNADLTVYAGDAEESSYGIYVDDAYLYGIGDCSFFGGAVGEYGRSLGAYAWSFNMYGGKYEEDVPHGVRFVGDSAAFVGRSSSLPYLDVRGGDYTYLCAQTKDEADLAEPDDATNAMETAKHVFLRSDAMVSYNIYVGGTEVTYENAADVLGDGTVSFNPNSNTFVFNNATITSGVKKYNDIGGFYSEFDNDLYIELIGENVIDLTEADVSGVGGVCGMFGTGDFTFYGDGSLTILVPASDVEDGASYGIYTYDDVWVYDTAAITVTAPDVEDAYGFYCEDECGIDSPNVSLTAGGTALYAYYGVNNDSEFTATFLTSNEYGGEVEENDSFCSDSSVRDACKTVQSAAGSGSGTGTPYDIYVGGKRVTSGNQDDVFGDGTVAYAYDYDRGGHVLTLNNADITSYSRMNGDTAGIYCAYNEPLYIELVGNNTISVADDTSSYVMGIYAYDHIHVTGDGMLTINVESNYNEDGNGYSYGINADYESNDVYLEADGEIAIHMTGAVNEAKGIYANKFYNRNNADVTISVSEAYAARGAVTANNIYLQSPANFTVSASFGEFDEGYPYAYGISTYTLYDSPVSGPVYIEGNTQAIYVNGSCNIQALILTAYESVDDETPVENPDWYNLPNYEKVELSRAPHTVTPVLTTTEAECSWWDDGKGEDVGNDEPIEIGWDVGGEEITGIQLYCDRQNDGNFAYEVSIDPTVDSTYSIFATGDDVLPCATHAWVIAAEFADGTVAFSEPFDLTFYRVISDYVLEIEVGAPAIGYTPSDVEWIGHAFDEDYKDKPTFTWYKMDGETGVEMADDDMFMPGEEYAVIAQGTLEDALRFDEETMVFPVTADGVVAESDVLYDDETNLLKVGVLFAPLKDTIRYIGVEMAEPDATMTPADVSAAVKGYQGYTPIALPMVDGKLNFSWTYCEGDTYVEANAVEMGDTEHFTGGNIYRGEISFKLKDRFTLTDLTEYHLAPGGSTGPAIPLNGKYDDATGIVTVTLPDLIPRVTVNELNMFVCEPEAGQTPNDISAFGDGAVEDYIDSITLEWYELDGEGTPSDTPLSSGEEFKAGVSYRMSMHVLLNGEYFKNSMIPVTLNDQTPPDAIVNYWDSAYIGQTFTIPETTTTIDALDFTVAAVKAGDTPADVAVTFDTDKVSFVDVYTYVYVGNGDPNKDMEHYAEMAYTDVFEYGKIYAIEVEYVLKSGVENAEEIAFTINGEEPLFVGLDGKKHGTVVMNFTLEEPTLALAADTTEFTLGDEALKAVNFAVEYSFEPTDRLLVDVVNADGDDVFCTALAAGTESFALDMSGDNFAVGTYTVFVTAYDGANAVVSNSVDVVVKAKPTTTESTTATTTETEPSATVTEPSATVTEPTTTGTEADDILYGDANGDGAVNMKDVLILRKFLAGIDVSYVEFNSDVNGDGAVNMKDVLILRKFLAGIITVIDPTA